MIPLLSIWSAIGGFFDTLMQPLYAAVSGVLVLFHMLWAPLTGKDSGWTWLLATICLTAVVRSAMIPLYVRTINSQRAMTAIQPKLQDLQKKYAGDRERLGQEQMALYKEEGINPMASCFPLLIQMPIFWALFQVLNGAARNHAQGYFLQHRPDLVESLNHATLFGGRLSGTFMPLTNFGPTQILAGVLVLLLCATMFLTQLHMMNKNMTPAAMEGPFAQQQKIMLYVFPLMYLFSGAAVPVGVLLYWTISNVWTLVQQWIMIRINPTPGTPAYLDWEERMRAKGQDPRAIEREREEKRLAKRNAKRQTSTSGATTVQRQQVSNGKVVRQASRTVSAPASAASPAEAGSVSVSRPSKKKAAPAAPAADEAGKPTVVRQQPRKAPRSVRRKS